MDYQFNILVIRQLTDDSFFLCKRFCWRLLAAFVFFFFFICIWAHGRCNLMVQTIMPFLKKLLMFKVFHWIFFRLVFFMQFFPLFNFFTSYCENVTWAAAVKKLLNCRNILHHKQKLKLKWLREIVLKVINTFFYWWDQSNANCNFRKYYIIANGLFFLLVPVTFHCTSQWIIVFANSFDKRIIKFVDRNKRDHTCREFL